MRLVVVDKDGNQHCWKCGGQGFTNDRTTRVMGELGNRTTFSTSKLRCVHCGEFNDLRSAVEYS